MITLWDTHCHLTGYDHPSEVMVNAAAAGVGIIAVSEEPGQYKALRARLGRRAGIVPALGMHPLRASSFTPSDLARFLRMLPDATWIGEVGLDFSPTGHAFQRAQLRIFEAILSDPRAHTRPLTVHSRGAERETIQRLAQIQHTKAILHWYTGPVSLVPEAIEAGLWFSVNPAMAASTRAKQILREIPLEQVLLETDGPFTRFGGRSAYPADLPALLAQLGRIWAVDLAALATQLAANQDRLFRDQR